MNECIFCQIINKKIPSEIVLENDKVIVFKDINPKAEIHLLIVPKKHIANINEINEEDRELLGELFLTAKKIAQQLSLIEKGYKLVMNVGRGAGQLIDHIHLHLLSGSFNRSLKEI
ncbi:MAG: histidine triad nucleotide-binding protein [Patescibacteria group bacterium]|jgi:histidine triad (HIT) family protein|nr:histidine triad nucleotide-binding protein [Patescibacteria group bacterium]